MHINVHLKILPKTICPENNSHIDNTIEYEDTKAVKDILGNECRRSLKLFMEPSFLVYLRAK